MLPLKRFTAEERAKRQEVNHRLGCLSCADTASRVNNPQVVSISCPHSADGTPAFDTCPYADELLKYPSYSAYVRANPYKIYAHATI